MRRSPRLIGNRIALVISVSGAVYLLGASVLALMRGDGDDSFGYFGLALCVGFFAYVCWFLPSHEGDLPGEPEPTLAHTPLGRLVIDTWRSGKNAKAVTARRLMLAVGVLLCVVNILPNYLQNFRGGGGYYWSSESSLLLGIGAVLIVLAVLTKPKDEPF